LGADEVEDGIAAGAQAQAKLWAEAAKEGATDGSTPTPVDPSFIRELLRMGDDSQTARSRGILPSHKVICFLLFYVFVERHQIITK
jgi:hypothetical protein